MKKILASLVTIIFVLGMLCGCGGTEYPSGSFYTMEEAYENGWITKEDIMEVCYRRFGSVYECSAENPEESVEVDYTSPYPDPVLDRKTEKAIIHADYVRGNGQEHGISESDYTLTFYGEFDGSYIVLMRCSKADDDCAIWDENIADIVWSHSGYANDFRVFRFDE